MAFLHIRKSSIDQTVSLKADASDADRRKLRILVGKAEKSCMISRAIQGNVALELEPTIS